MDVFFVLSGYLITALLLAERSRRGRISVTGFWARRARRILPALYCLLAGTLAFAVIFHRQTVAELRGDALASFAYVANWYFALHREPYFETVGRPSPLLHLWSLGVEEQFYLLWPLVLGLALVVLRRWTPLAVLAGAAAAAVLMAVRYHPGMDPSRVYYGTDTHATGLLLGACLAFFWVPGQVGSRAGAVASGPARRLRAAVEHRLVLDALGLAALGALLYLFLRLGYYQAFLYRGGFALVALLTVAAIVAVSHPRSRLASGLLEWGPVRWLGLRSYGIYLWHWPVVVFTQPHADLPLAGVPLLALRVGAALVLAEVSYRWVVKRHEEVPT